MLTLSWLKLCEIWSFQYTFVQNSEKSLKKNEEFTVFQTEKM